MEGIAGVLSTIVPTMTEAATLGQTASGNARVALFVPTELKAPCPALAVTAMIHDACRTTLIRTLLGARRMESAA